MKRNILILFSLFFIAMGPIVSVFASGNSEDADQKWFRHRGFSEESIASFFGVTEEQLEQVQGIMDQFETDTEEQREAYRDARSNLNDLLDDSELVIADIEQALAQVSELRNELTIERLKLGPQIEEIVGSSVFSRYGGRHLFGLHHGFYDFDFDYDSFSRGKRGRWGGRHRR